MYRSRFISQLCALTRFLRDFCPFLRASERPIAMACSRLVTFPPLPPFPDFNVPFFLRCIATFYRLSRGLAVLSTTRTLLLRHAYPPSSWTEKLFERLHCCIAQIRRPHPKSLLAFGQEYVRLFSTCCKRHLGTFMRPSFRSSTCVPRPAVRSRCI